MSKERNFAIKFGGVGSSAYHDGQMKVKYFNAFAKYDADLYFGEKEIGSWKGGKVENYADIFTKYLTNSETSNFYPLIHNYSNDAQYNVSAFQGLCPVGQKGGQQYSIYRREYEVYTVPGMIKYGYYYNQNFYEDNTYSPTSIIPKMVGVYYIDKNTEYCYQYDSTLGTFIMVSRAKIYTGEWEPVVLSSSEVSIYDYNIANNKTYQYIIYPNDKERDLNDNELQTSVQVFANSDENYKVWQPDSTFFGQGKLINGSRETSSILGAPISTYWNEWSICELIPESHSDKIPLVKNAYTVNQDQIWKFKFSLKTGEQKQNISRSEFQTLDQFPKIGYGKLNYASGEVSALMGSEIVLGTKSRYIERTGTSRISPLSTNEKVKMLEQWHKFVASNNPKLLKDIKGQSWIVQIMSAGNTTENFYNSTPDTINFQWKQIGDTKNVIIYSSLGKLTQEDEKIGSLPYKPLFGKGN